MESACGAIDPRFHKLSWNNQISYISDILIPVALVLITTRDFMEENEISAEEARQLAQEHLKEIDIVAWVGCLRCSGRLSR